MSRKSPSPPRKSSPKFFKGPSRHFNFEDDAPVEPQGRNQVPPRIQHWNGKQPSSPTIWDFVKQESDERGIDVTPDENADALDDDWVMGSGQ